MSKNDLHAYNIFDLRDIALKRVPKGLFEFMDRGTEDEVSLKNNRAVFDRLRFKPRTHSSARCRSNDGRRLKQDSPSLSNSSRTVATSAVFGSSGLPNAMVTG